ncbi:MAG: PEGA domain-containing protein [Butyrivibrio sp.]|nr:PEGA domain-containing protein [Butyrivibrio sp.]
MINNKKLRALSAVVMAMVTAFVFLRPVTVFAGNGEKVVSLIGKYDSADTAAIRSVDTDKKLIRFRNHATGKTYTLSYDNTSMIYDGRGTPLSASLLEPGQIVDVTFLKSTKHVTTLYVSKDAWVLDETRDHELVRGDGTAKVKGETYKIDARTLVLADDDLALAEDILATDQVKISGIGKDIYSVVVTGGHGYVSLSSDTVEDHSLVGAWLELDNAVIHKISPNMLLSAPEGEYTLQILGNGASYQQEVKIARNQETVVDTGSVKISKPKEGLVTFDVTPETAEVFVDGEKVLTGVSQTVRYGYHNLKVMAEGYETQDKYLKVGTPKSVVRIELEKDKSSSGTASATASSSGKSGDDSSSSHKSLGVSRGDGSIANKSSSASSASTKPGKVSDNDSSGTTTTNKVIKGYKIYIDEPSGAEVYFDGNYIGMAPTNTPKISGTHEIILKKHGYKTKSYRISIDKEETDLKYTFPDLVKDNSDSGESDKDSGNGSGKGGGEGTSVPVSDATTSDTTPSGDVDDSDKTGDTGKTDDTEKQDEDETSGKDNTSGDSHSGPSLGFVEEPGSTAGDAEDPESGED